MSAETERLEREKAFLSASWMRPEAGGVSDNGGGNDELERGMLTLAERITQADAAGVGADANKDVAPATGGNSERDKVLIRLRVARAAIDAAFAAVTNMKGGG